MRGVRSRSQDNRKLVVESVALGLGYTGVLIWAGAALVGSFGYDIDAAPYWPDIPHLRTDTVGAAAFLVAIVTLVASKYLELRRRSDVPTEPVPRSARVLTVQAVAETAVVLGTALVIYLSCNAFMHPWTLRLQLTHLSPWPSRGHGPGDRAGYLPRCRRHPPLPAGHRAATQPGHTRPREGQRRRLSPELGTRNSELREGVMTAGSRCFLVSLPSRTGSCSPGVARQPRSYRPPASVTPPSSTRVWPVIQLAWSDSRNATAPAMSAGTPRRLSG